MCIKTRQSKKKGLGMACVTYSREERCILGLDGKPEGKGHLGDLGVGGIRIVLK